MESKRALILYSGEGNMAPIAEGLAQGLEEGGWQTQRMQAEPRGTGAISLAPYQLVCVGSPVQGFFGGRIALDIDMTVKRCSRFEGKHSVAFVRPRMFGNGKALRYLMGVMERQGAWVQDFASLLQAEDAKRFAKRLLHLGR